MTVGHCTIVVCILENIYSFICNLFHCIHPCAKHVTSDNSVCVGTLQVLLHVQHLVLRSMQDLTALKGLDTLQKLTALEVYSCPLTSALTPPATLELLRVRDCPRLEELRCNSTRLHTLSILHCPRLRQLPSALGQHTLQLHVSKAHRSQLAAISQLAALEHISVHISEPAGGRSSEQGRAGGQQAGAEEGVAMEEEQEEEEEEEPMEEGRSWGGETQPACCYLLGHLVGTERLHQSCSVREAVSTRIHLFFYRLLGSICLCHPQTL
jgi:hypothetical protein